MEIPWILVAVGVLLVIFLGIFIWKYRKGDHQNPSYKSLFQMGIIFTGAGIPMMVTLGPTGSPLFILGLVYIAIGLANRDKWDSEPEKTKIDAKTKNLIIAVLVLVILIVLGYIALSEGILSF